jgi:hypothetical protein
VTTDYTYEVIVRVDEETGKAKVLVTGPAQGNEQETVAVSAVFESGAAAKRVGNTVLSMAWAAYLNNDRDAYEC